MIAAVVGVVCFMARPTVVLNHRARPDIGMGWTVVSAVVFWPCGLVAIAHASRAIAAAENDDMSLSPIFARKARLWRNIAFGIAGALFVLALIAGA